MTHHHARKRATPPPYWTERLRNALPTREVLTAHPWLKPIANRVLEPKLWRLQHEAVARGVAIGTFWAFAIPVGQVIASTAHCVWWRGHIPVAAGVTLVTNPLTIGFWLWLAYQLGSLVLGGSATEALPSLQGSGVLAWLAAYGAPTVLGMGLFATAGAALGYSAVKLGWRVRIWLKRRHRGSRGTASI
jgi:uncharacterized protein (DUF2062 family)